MCYSAHMGVKGQLLEVCSLLSLGFWGLNLGHQILMASALHWPCDLQNEMTTQLL